MTDRTTLSRGNQALVDRHTIENVPLDQIIHLNNPNAPYLAAALIVYYTTRGDLSRVRGILEYMEDAQKKLGAPATYVDAGDDGTAPEPIDDDDDDALDDLQ